MKDEGLEQYNNSFVKGRPLVFFALIYALGLYLGRHIDPSLAIKLFLALNLSILIIILSKILDSYRAISIFFAAIFLGFLVSSTTFHPKIPSPGEYEVKAIVSSIIEKKDSNSFAAKIKNIYLDGEPISGNAYWTFNSKQGDSTKAIGLGDSVVFQGKLYHPSKSRNPYGFDFFNYILKSDMTFGISGDKNLIIKANNKNNVNIFLKIARESLDQRLYELIGENNSLVSAMVLGKTDRLEDTLKEEFYYIGIGHVLAISGLHVGILAWLIAKLLEKTGIGIKMQWLVTALCLLVYILFIEKPISAVRAGLIFLVFLGAKATGRRYDELSALAFAFLFILLIRPVEIFLPGFQMSFGAVLGIVILRQPIEEVLLKIFRKQKGENYILKSLAVTLSAQFGILLPMIYWFYRAPLLGTLANLILLPMVSIFLIPLYYITTLFAYIPVLSTILGKISFVFTRLLIWIGHKLSKVPGMVVRVSMPSFFFIAAAILFVWLVSKYSNLKTLKSKLIIYIFIIAFLALGAIPFEQPIKYMQLSVGQADAAILEDGRYTAVIDTGENGHDLARYLLLKGRNIDALFISHVHLDHLGGVQDLLDKGIIIKEVYVPLGIDNIEPQNEGHDILKKLKNNNIPINYLSYGDKISFPRAEFNVLWPFKDKIRYSRSANDNSMVLELLTQQFKILTTGDITAEYEKYSQVQADIIKIAHHGSAYSNQKQYLKAVMPRFAIISSGTSERLPAIETLQTLEELEIPYYNTQDTGCITIKIEKNSYNINTHFKKGDMP